MRSIIAATLGTILITGIAILSARKIGLERTYNPSPLWTEVQSLPNRFVMPDSTCQMAANPGHTYLPLRRSKDGIWLVRRDGNLTVEGLATELRSQTFEQLAVHIPNLQNCRIEVLFAQTKDSTVILDILEMRPDAYEELEAHLKILVPEMEKAADRAAANAGLGQLDSKKLEGEPAQVPSDIVRTSIATPKLIVISPFKRVLEEFRRAQPKWAFGTTDDQVYRSVTMADMWLEPMDPANSLLVVVPDVDGRMPRPNTRWFEELQRRHIPFFIRPSSGLSSYAWIKELQADFPNSIWGIAD
jgi:hypothetical protein